MGGKGGGGNDASKAAQLQGDQAQALNEQQTWANRPNQYNAWGSTEWESKPVWDESSGQYINQWAQVENLNPQLQAALDAQFGIQQGRSELAASQFGNLAESMKNPHDFDQYGKPVAFDSDTDALRQRAEDAAYQRQTNRLDPQFNQRAEALEASLRNKGLRPGDQAYEAQMDNFNRSRNDAYEQARLGSTQEGRTEAGQMFGQNLQANERANALRTQQVEEDLFKRGFSLQEINTLLAGQGVAGSTPSATESQDSTVASHLSGKS